MVLNLFSKTKKVRNKADFHYGRRVGWRKKKLPVKVFSTTGAVPLMNKAVKTAE